MDSTAANEYEAQRAQRIAENRQRLQTLEINTLSTKVGVKKGGSVRSASAGLDDTAAGCPGSHQSTKGPPPVKRRFKKHPSVEKEQREPVKRSRRLRGQSAETATEIAEELKEEIPLTKKNRALDVSDGGAPRIVEAPFTLMSIGVTVLDAGHIHRGAWAHRYWSSGGARYHHAYPVGYKATKHQYGSEYLMEIKEGDYGPIFQVTDLDTQAVYEGESPTAPWTDVCLAKRPSARISGPLFFGFSDPLTITAITSLYDERERSASLLGEPAPSANPDAVELAARDFMTLGGVGELGAIAIASTVSLGASRHPSVESLAKWVRSKEQNRSTLLEFLLYSSEMPNKVRSWPKWRHIAPRISASLAGEEAVVAP